MYACQICGFQFSSFLPESPTENFAKYNLVAKKYVVFDSSIQKSIYRVYNWFGIKGFVL